MSIAEKITQFRLEAGMSQYALSKKIGVSQSFVSQLENGARAGKPHTMQLIANALNCSYDELTGEPKFFVQFMRNCKGLSHSQIVAVNEIVLQMKSVRQEF